ncbi:hypothetical protein FI667_g1571, partial [Globisporangium splendens]
MLSKNATLKLLVLSELDGQILRVNRLCERLVCSDDSDIDVILVSGGLVATRAPGEYEALEAVAAAEGDMMAIISRLEMIICRVLYIPDDNDPPTTRSLVVPSPTLTQYSSNVFCREQQVLEGVVVMGESHYFKSDPRSRPGARVARFSCTNPAAYVSRHSRTRFLNPASSRSLVADTTRPTRTRLWYSQNLMAPPFAWYACGVVGSFHQGQFMILELEKQSVDDSWHIARSHSHHLPFDDDDDDDF